MNIANISLSYEDELRLWYDYTCNVTVNTIACGEGWVCEKRHEATPFNFICWSSELGKN